MLKENDDVWFESHYPCFYSSSQLKYLSMAKLCTYREKLLIHTDRVTKII